VDRFLPIKIPFAALGGLGLFLSSLIDSSFLPLPLVTDLLLMELSSRHPLRTPYYAAMATIGSLAGCIWIYLLARKAGQAYYRSRHEAAPGRFRVFMQQYPLASVFLPAVAPFPVPFKPFVVAQGVFQVPLPVFLLGTLLGRGCRFFLEGFLGARYGAAAKQFIVTQKWPSLAVGLLLALIIFLIYRLPFFRGKQPTQSG